MLVAAAADMTGIELVSVTGISSDGQWFTGVATTPTTPAGETVGFIRQYCDDAIGAACSTVATPPFGVGAASDTLAVAAGQSASVVLTITPAAGFSDAESFACAGLPVGGSCSFAQRSGTDCHRHAGGDIVGDGHGHVGFDRRVHTFERGTGWTRVVDRRSTGSRSRIDNGCAWPDPRPQAGACQLLSC